MEGKNSTALFTGTFDPFTCGHDDIVRRALRMFGKVVIGVVGDNVHKPGMAPVGERKAAIEALYEGNDAVTVREYSGLAADLAREVGASCFIKGVRSAKDFEYEREMGEINRRLSGVDTVLIMADPALAHVSSSLIRELQHFGRDVSELLPKRSNKAE